MRFIGIIPARYASTRFPGKPLAMLGDKPMIQRVYEQARKALDEVVVATDDERIYQAVEQFGGRAIMTRKDHKCGTDRCLEAYDRSASGVNKDDKETVIINIQGDEPFIQPEQIEAIKACFPTEIATLVKPLSRRTPGGAGEPEYTEGGLLARDGQCPTLLTQRDTLPAWDRPRGLAQAA